MSSWLGFVLPKLVILDQDDPTALLFGTVYITSIILANVQVISFFEIWNTPNTLLLWLSNITSNSSWCRFHANF
jgi:hypothetical protein